MLPERLANEVLTQVEPWLRKKSDAEKFEYLETLCTYIQQLQRLSKDEADVQLAKRGLLQLHVVAHIAVFMLKLLESASQRGEGPIVDPEGEKIASYEEEPAVSPESLMSLRTQVNQLCDFVCGVCQLRPLPEERNSIYLDTPTTRKQKNINSLIRNDSCKKLVSFLQITRNKESIQSVDSSSQSTQGLKENSINSVSLRKRNMGRSRETTFATEHESLTEELLKVTSQLKQGSEKVYESLEKDQERLGKLSSLLDSNLERTEKQGTAARLYKKNVRSASWVYWIILIVLPLLWIVVYMTIRFL